LFAASVDVRNHKSIFLWVNLANESETPIIRRKRDGAGYIRQNPSWFSATQGDFVEIVAAAVVEVLPVFGKGQGFASTFNELRTRIRCCID
jgi:hypothetical protein